MRGIWTRLSRDDGMTIVEVMIAAAVLFFVITALLGLIMQTLNTGMQSKQTAVFTNYVNSYIERVQGMQFDNVVVGTLPGQLASVETTTFGDYVIEIRPEVFDGGTADLKKLVVTATIRWGTRPVQTMSTDVVIRNKDAFLTQASQGPAVTWKTVQMPSPDGNEIVWDNLRESGGLLYLGVIAEAADGRTITKVTIKSDNSWPLESYAGEIADWSIAEADREQVWELDYWNWNTAQTGVKIIGEPEVAVIPDGLRTIKVRVDDSAGGFTERTFTLFVDNVAPLPPVDLGLGLAPTGPVAKWVTRLDGSMLPPSCTAIVSKQDVAGSWVAETITGITASQVDLTPFSRYIVSVKAIGVRPDNPETGESLETTPVPILTPPKASGTRTTVKNGKNVVSLSVSEPTFKTTGVPSYVWYIADSPNGPWTTPVATTREVTELAVPVGKNANEFVPMYYRCFVSFTPAVDAIYDPSPASVTLGSSVLGPTGYDVVTAVPLGEQWLP